MFIEILVGAALFGGFNALVADLLNPEKVEVCSGCGTEYRVRDCGCPAGSRDLVIASAKASGLSETVEGQPSTGGLEGRTGGVI